MAIVKSFGELKSDTSVHHESPTASDEAMKFPGNLKMHRSGSGKFEIQGDNETLGDPLDVAVLLPVVGCPET